LVRLPFFNSLSENDQINTIATIREFPAG